MARGQVFKMNDATLGILSTGDHQRIAVRVPKGATITLLDGDVNGTRFVDIEWDRKTLRMFAVDIRDRATQVRAASS